MGYVYENDFGVVKGGEYEAVIEKIEQRTTPNGKEKLAITYSIRDDIDQDYKNRKLFEDIWKEKDNPDYYNRRRLNQLIGTQGVEKGTQFNTIEDIISLLVGAKIRLVVATQINEYNGEEENKISYYKPTKFKDKQVVELTENELPF